MKRYFRNKKNGEVYELLHTAVDCTNKGASREFIVYKHKGTDHSRIFVREAEEFYLKFEEV
jgi:hypothetical protein